MTASYLNRNVVAGCALTLVLCLLTASSARAQITSNADNLTLPEKFPQIQEQLDINITPETPAPGDTVTISVETYSLDLNAQLVTWKVNGAEKLKGIGQKKFTFTLGQAGFVSAVQLTINTAGGSEIVKVFEFAPVNVDVLWQANTYTPPFYKGKALFTPEANVMFVAMPNIVAGSQRVDPSNVVYTWKLNYDVQGSLSGFGKNTFDFNGPIFTRPALVEAAAYAASNPSLKGAGQITVTPENPLALIYEDNPILGILFNKEIGGNYFLNAKEVKVAAYPYFFSTLGKNLTVNYNWNLNANPISTVPSTQNNIVLRRTDNDAGASAISLYVGNDSKILQEASNGTVVSYGSGN